MQQNTFVFVYPHETISFSWSFNIGLGKNFRQILDMEHHGGGPPKILVEN